MTEKIKQLAKEALSIQDACNLLGLSKRFPLAIQELADELRVIGDYSTDNINQHPVTQAWVDKLSHLAGTQGQSFPDCYETLYDIVAQSTTH